jgi:hypothetical protein
MRLGRGSRSWARRWLTALSVVTCGVAVAAGPWGGARDVADTWTTLVEAADQGGAVDLPRGRGGPRLTARQAYLLAFHEAQDAADPEHVLAVADRLDAIGEGALASHVRRAAGSLLVELGAKRDAAGEDAPAP